MTDEKIESLLKRILAQLALGGAALHICEQFTPRDTYRLLREKIATEWVYYPQLIGTGFVQNYDTAEYCPECAAMDEKNR